MPETWNPFSGDFWTEENWFGGQGQRPWQIDPNARAYGTGAAGQSMQELLQKQARGEGPSLGRGLIQEGLRQAISNQQAQAAGMSGINPALAMKLTGERAGAMTSDAQRQAAQVGLQEQMGAQQALRDWIQRERDAQVALDRDRIAQRNLFQQRLMGYDPATEGIFGDVAGMVGSGLGFALGGPLGGAAGGQMGRQMGGGGRGIYPNDPIWGF